MIDQICQKHYEHLLLVRSHHAQLGRRLRWCGLKTEAEKIARLFDSDPETESVEIVPISVPAHDRNELINWLNIHFNLDNG